MRSRTAFLLAVTLFTILYARVTFAADPANYRVQSGDVLTITLWNEENNVQEVKVDPEGQLTYPMAGVVPVKGLTLAAVADRLSDRLKNQIKRPRLTVSLKQARPQAGVYVLGAVGKPGPYEFLDGMRVKDAIGLAGGLAPEADAVHATLARPGKAPLPLDLDALFNKGNAAANLVLTFGDVINVPSRDFAARGGMLAVMVVGQAQRPGSLQLTTGARLSDAVTAAGGPTPQAALRRATLARKGQNTAVDLDRILRQGDLSGNEPLQDGDVLLIPEARNQVTLVGEFQKPGSYPFREGDTLTGAVALGGGATEKASLQRAALTRDGKSIPVDLFAMLKQGDLQADQPLQDGDVFILPAAKHEITLLGEFTKPGVYPFQDGNTLAQAIALGEGPTEAADLRRAILKRGGKEIPVDLYVMLKQGDLKADQPLQDGDVLMLPSGQRIYAYGAFVKPGPVTVTDEMKLVDVLVAAGGTTKDARLNKACVARMVDGKPVKLPLNLKEILAKGSPGRAFQFTKGDVLYVPDKTGINWQGALSAVYMLTLSATQIFN